MSYDFELYEVSEVSRGITDFYIDASKSHAENLDNFNLQKNGKPKTRPGRRIYDSDNPQIPAGNQRISALIKITDSGPIVAPSSTQIYSLSTSWSTITGPTSNPAFPNSSTTRVVSFDRWKDHTIITSSSFDYPLKLYLESSTLKLRTAGLPKPSLYLAITLANDLKAKFNAHRVDLSQHASADNTNTVTASNATNFTSLQTLVTALISAYTAHNADSEVPGPWSYHIGINSSTHVLTSTDSINTITGCVNLLLDIKSKFNAHDADASAHTTPSLHQVSISSTPSVTSGAGANTYLYKALFYYTYDVTSSSGNTITNEDFSPTISFSISSADASTKSISNLPVLVNGTTGNWDTSNIKVKIYRTINAGTDYYYVGEVTNGTTTFSDTVSDATLITNEAIYTAGGVLENDPPPIAKYFTQANGIGVYANLATTLGSNSFITSKPDDIDSVPESFIDNLEKEITGCTSIGIYPVLFTPSSAYRLEGLIDEQGRGTIFKREISRNYGCISNNSIVRIPQGIVFFGQSGIYFSDGFEIKPISLHIPNTYQSIIDNTALPVRIYGEYDVKNNLVLWAIETDSATLDNDSILVLDLNFPLTEESVFYYHSGYGESMRPTALLFYQGSVLMADKRGYLLKYDSDATTDPKIDPLVTSSDWDTYPIIWDYKGPAASFTTPNIAKWVPVVTLEAKGETNTSISIRSNNNDKNNFIPLKEIRNRENITWGDDTVVWGSTEFDYPWNSYQIVKAKRRFPAGNLRCFLKQIQITNAYTIVYASDDYESASSSLSSKTVTLSTEDWPNDVVDYYISFEDDLYDTQFLITERTTDKIITVQDPLNELPTDSSIKWQISGYRKGDTLDFISMAIKYGNISQSQEVYRGATGGNT